MCGLVQIGYDAGVGDNFIAEFLRFTHLMPEATEEEEDDEPT